MPPSNPTYPRWDVNRMSRENRRKSAWERACRPFDRALVDAASHWQTSHNRPLCEYVCGGMYRVDWVRVRGLHAAANRLREYHPREVRRFAGNDNLLMLPTSDNFT